MKIICNFARSQRNMGVREKMVKYLKWLLPVIFIAYYSSITLFIHVHIEHGTTIVHSHPFGAKSAALATIMLLYPKFNCSIY